MKVRVTITIPFCFSLLYFLALAGPAFCQQPYDVGQLSRVDLAAAPKAFHEDWSTPVLDRSTFLTDMPVLAETDDIPKTGFIRQRYSVNWRPKDLFDLYVIRPRGVAKPPVILALYSFPDDTENFKNNAWCEEAVSKGYAVVGFVSAVTGHRVRFRLAKESFLSEMKESLASTAHDVQLILDYLARRGDLDMNHVGMFGVGSGGSVAILASAVDPRLVALDLLGPWGDWSTWVAESKIIKEDERPAFLKKEFLDGVAPLDPVVWLPKSQAKALRLQDVRHNLSIPDAAQEKLEAVAPEFAVVNQYGNGRALMREQPSAATLDWIKEQLKPGTRLARRAVEKSARVHVFAAVEKPAEAKWPNVGGADSAAAGTATTANGAPTPRNE